MKFQEFSEQVFRAASAVRSQGQEVGHIAVPAETFEDLEREARGLPYGSLAGSGGALALWEYPVKVDDKADPFQVVPR